MTRAVPEWKGKSDDEAVPPRVRLRVYDRAHGRCQKCTRKLQPGHWDIDHIVAIANGGPNRESNLQALCDDPCHPLKSKQDVTEKSRTYKRRKSHVGIRKSRSPVPGSRASKWRRRMNGTVERRT